MKNKTKFILPILALGILFSSSIALAQTTTGSTTTTQSPCVTAALAARRAAVKTANLQFRTDMKTAQQTRMAAFKTARAETDKTARMNDMKTANAAFRTSMKTINQARMDAVKAAYATYKTAEGACN
jgi:hypothetical protein